MADHRWRETSGDAETGGEIPGDAHMAVSVGPVAQQAAEVYNDVNTIHAFREGNGRSQRVWMDDLARGAGYELDWTKVTGLTNNLASQSAREGDLAPLHDVFRQITSPIPAQEVRMRGRRHSKRRDADAISHHYDVSNRFYRMLLGPSMAYTCAVFPEVGASLEAAQEYKFDLVCRKLGLASGDRLLDVGCGWGGMPAGASSAGG